MIAFLQELFALDHWKFPIRKEFRFFQVELFSLFVLFCLAGVTCTIETIVVLIIFMFVFHNHKDR